MQEIWKDIIGFEGWYQVSNLGRVRSLDRDIIFDNGKSKTAKMRLNGKVLSITRQTQGYSQVGLSKHNLRKSYRLNRLVANAFIPNPENKPEVNHIDGDKKNNRVDNLEWVTGKENIQHAIKTGLVDRRNRRKAVLQIDMEGKIVAEFDSIKSAAKNTGIQNGTICAVCKGYKHAHTAGGFYWMYKDG